MRIEVIEIEEGSARYSSADGSSIDCVVRLSHMPDTLLPFTATANDPEPHGKAVWNEVLKLPIAAYIPPPTPEPLPDYDAELSDAIKAATTLDELKSALVGSIANSKARVGGKPK